MDGDGSKMREKIDDIAFGMEVCGGGRVAVGCMWGVGWVDEGGDEGHDGA